MSAILVTFTGDIETLSARQRQCLTLYAKGRLAKQIAGDIGIAQKTVEYHLEAVRTKLGLSLVQAVVQAAKAGWV